MPKSKPSTIKFCSLLTALEESIKDTETSIFVGECYETIEKDIKKEKAARYAVVAYFEKWI